MITVSLWDICSPMLIVPAKTGVLYENQTCGSMCCCDKLEGYLIPVSNDYDPYRYVDSLDFALSSLFPEGFHGFLDKELGEKIRILLEKDPSTVGIKINWNKFDESHEAWLHVILNDTDFSPYKGFENVEAVLTWCNSD